MKPITKKCSKCKEIKDIDFFYPDRPRNTYMSLCKKCENERYKIRYKRNPQKCQSWKKKNPSKCLEHQRKWEANNPEKAKEVRKKSTSKLRGTIKGRLNHNISNSVCKSLHGNKCGRSWELILGYTINDLKNHLEKQFQDGMTWENYGARGWHLDHITPISVFNFEKPEDDDFKRCWALKNLRPIWASENLKKQAKIVKPFQPRLIFK